MSEFDIHTVINAPRAVVWETLADLGTIQDWNSGVVKSHWKGDKRDGVGSARHCTLKMGTVEERAVEWEDLERIKIQLHEHTKMPFKIAHADFKLSDVDGGTRIDLHYDYEPKFGPIGAVLDKFATRKMMTKGLGGLLRDLKKHLETTSV